MFYELARLALDNLGRARARLAMTAAGVLVGTTAVILLVALTIGLQQAAEASIGNNAAVTLIDVYPNWSPDAGENVPQLTPDAVRAFWQIPGVAAVIPSLTLQGGELIAGDYHGSGWTLGIDPALLPYLGIDVQRGQLSLQPGEILVGARVGENFYDPTATEWQPIKVDLMETPLKLNLFQFSPEGVASERKLNITVSGEIREGSNYDYAIFMPIQDVVKYNQWITGYEIDPEDFRYDQITVRATSRETVNEVAQAIRDLGYGAGGLGDYINQLNGFFGTMRVVLGGVGGVALIVAAFGVTNTMMMAIIERTREIGLMKAIGATDRDVLTVFLIEAGLVGLAGGVAGVMLSYALQNLVNQAIQNLPAGEGGMSFLPIDPNMIGGNLIVIPPELALLAVALSVAVGVGAGLYPALRAAQLPPVIALKQE